MKKSIYKAILMAMVLVLALPPVAQADTFISPIFRFFGIGERPTATPTVEPTEAPTAEPLPEVVAEPTAEPQPEPTAEPLPEITATITSNLPQLDWVGIGTEMILTLTVEGNGDYDYVVQWQMSSDCGVTWQDIPDAHGDQFKLILAKEHNGVYWRATVDLVVPDAAE